MLKIKEILRLTHVSQLSQRQIARSLRLSSAVVNKYLQLARRAKLAWPLPEEWDEQQLQAHLLQFSVEPVLSAYSKPDYAKAHQELKRKGVTLQLLWEEYQSQYGPQAYKYSRYCDYYRQWLQRHKPSLRQLHKAGDKLFIDYAGNRIDIIDPSTGEIRSACIFVAVLGASNYTYVDATWDQSLPSWIASHVRAFRFLGGVPALLVPDNLKAAVTKACRYEPDIHPTYADLAAHYGTAIMPTRPYKPKDKAKAETGVLIVQRWILARLRHHTFLGLGELNVAIAKLLIELNQKPFKKLPGNRHGQFLALDQPALRPLPPKPYELAEFKKARVSIDYHIELEGHYYSVPYQLVKQEIELRFTHHTVECLYKGKRVASHARNSRKGQHTTIAEHMPVSHQKHLEWTPGRFLNWAGQTGKSVQTVVKFLLESKAHPEQSYRACLGLLRLAKGYTPQRLEAACHRALAIGSPTRRSIQSILEKGLDQQAPLRDDTASVPRQHENLRGPDYYR